MKVLSTLLAILILAISLTACGNMPEQSEASAQSPSISASSIEDRLTMLEKQVVGIQQQLGWGLWSPSSADPFGPTRIDQLEKRIAQLENRVAQLERGNSSTYQPYTPSYP